MIGLADLLLQASSALADAAVPFALVGGLAVSVRTEPRFTRDVDLAVVVGDDAAAEQLVHRLCPPFVIVSIVEHDALDRLATARLSHPDATGAGPVLDLLFASSGIEGELVAAAEHLEVLPDVIVPVAGVGHLIALKLLSQSDDRPQDRIDLHALAGVATAGDRRVVADSIRLIASRGADRGRDLVAAWTAVAPP